VEICVADNPLIYKESLLSLTRYPGSLTSLPLAMVFLQSWKAQILLLVTFRDRLN